MRAGDRRRPDRWAAALATGLATRAALGALVLSGAWRLEAATLRVPQDFPTIKSAVSRAVNGDTVEVDDGVYLERGIVLSRPVVVRSKNLFGAVIYGDPDSKDAIFVVRAAARIEGFILKGGAVGIEQRDSPDVRWEARDIAVFGCRVGFSVNDRSDNIGSAVIRNVVVFGAEQASSGVSSNDAGRIDVARSLFLNCSTAFGGYNHLSFTAADSAAVDCLEVSAEKTLHRPVPPANSRIVTGNGFRAVRSEELREPRRRREFAAFLREIVVEAGRRGAMSSPDRSAAEALVGLVLGGVAEGGPDPAAAERIYEAAVAAAGRAGSWELGWQGLSRLAHLEGSGAGPGRAFRHHEAAIGFVERWAARVPTGITRIGFLRDKTPVYETLIGLLLDRHGQAPSGGFGERAFACAERLKALSRLSPARDREAGGALGTLGTGDPATAPAKAATARRITALQLELQDPGLSADEKLRLLSLLEEAEEGHNGALIAEERAAAGPRRVEGLAGPAGPPLAPLAPTAPLDCAGVKARLEGAAVVSYVLGKGGSYAFLVTEDGLACARLGAAAPLEDMIDPYLRFLRLPGRRDFEGERAGKVLFERLLGPFGPKLAELPGRVVIVPDGRLRYLPFEALVSEPGAEGGGRARFWGESKVISYASSATRALTRRSVSPPGQPRDGPAAGPADGPGREVLIAGSSSAIACDNRSMNVRQMFPPLSHVKREVRTLARLFPRADVTVLLDGEAREAWLKADDLRKYGLIHFAGHGVIDDANWWRSAFLLAPEKDGAEDGFLTALEAAELELRARLVVLSGCGTGLGRLYEGEGLRGLSGAFLAAGAENVLVSLWNVDDRVTAEFMKDFYSFLVSGDAPAPALARAKTRMIGRGLRNPFYWAPFVLIGADGGERRPASR